MKIKARLKCEYFISFFEEVEIELDVESKTVEEITDLIDSRFNDGVAPDRRLFDDGTEMPSDFFERLKEGSGDAKFGAKSISFGNKLVDLGPMPEMRDSANFSDEASDWLDEKFRIAKAEECRAILETETKNPVRPEHGPNRQSPL